MSFYSEMADMADELLREFGNPETIVLTRETPTGTEDNPGAPVRKDYRVSAVVNVKYLGSTEDDRTIIANKRSVILSTKMANGNILPIEPTAGDKFTFGGKTWGVESSAPIAPGGTNILYKMDITR